MAFQVAITFNNCSNCALHLDGDNWGGRHGRDLGGGVKRRIFSDKRDLGAMEEQAEGSIGRSPSLSFC